MSSNNQHQIHDIFFRKSMEQPIVAIDFLKSYLPKRILSRIDLLTLKQQKESFIEKDIGHGIVDCLYQAEIKSNKLKDRDNNYNNSSNNENTEIGYIYLILEHQTKSDRFIAFRLIKYMISIMEYHRKKYRDDKYLPLIYPILLYTGLNKYNAPTNLLELFRDQEFANMMISQFYQLIDINTISDEEMKSKIYAGSMMYIYKHRMNSLLADKIKLIRESLNVIIKEIGIDYPAVMLEYLLNAGEADEIQTNKLIDMFIELGNDQENKEKIMTIADNLRQQGEELGIQKGIQQGMQMTAINMLREGYNLDAIARITNIGEDELNTLKAKLS